MKRAITLASGTLAISLMSGTAMAQDVSGTVPVEEATGSPFVQNLSGGQTGSGRSISLAAGVTTTYESNIARAGQTSAGSRNLDRSDFRITPAVKATVNYPIGPHMFTTNGSIGYDFYARNSRLNRERIAVNSGLALKFARCDADLGASFNRRQSDLGDWGNVSGATVTTVKNVQTVTGVQAGASCGDSVGFRPSVGVGYQTASNTAAIRERNEHDTLNYSGGLIYQQPSIGVIKAFVQRSQTRFGQRPLPDGRDDGFNTMNYGVTVTRDIGTLWTLNGQVSHVDVKSRNPLQNDFSGIAWSLSLVGRPGPRLQVALDFDRSVRSSLTVDSDYNVRTRYGATANYVLTPRLRLQASYERQPRRLYGFQPIFGPAITRDRMDRAYASLAFDKSQRMRFHARAGVNKRSAAGTFYDYTSYLGELGVDFQF